jgi:hypothetical protein
VPPSVEAPLLEAVPLELPPLELPPELPLLEAVPLELPPLLLDSASSPPSSPAAGLPLLLLLQPVTDAARASDAALAIQKIRARVMLFMGPSGSRN